MIINYARQNRPPSNRQVLLTTAIVVLAAMSLVFAVLYALASALQSFWHWDVAPG
jgi:hypothetical protein